jgi:hypothetical protein
VKHVKYECGGLLLGVFSFSFVDSNIRDNITSIQIKTFVYGCASHIEIFKTRSRADMFRQFFCTTLNHGLHCLLSVLHWLQL